MRMLSFSKRNIKEILRDPLTMAFSLGFPLAILLLLSAIQANIPVDLFVIDNLTPGITVFGLSFMSLFSAMLIAKDRETAFLQRLYSTPMKAADYIFGYALPVIPVSLLQSVACYLIALCLGLKITVNMLFALLFIVPVSLLFIGMGLLFGSFLTVKQTGGICGALLTNLAAWLSGIWFDLDLVGGAFKAIAEALPFYHAVELERAVLLAEWQQILPHFLWVIGYAVVILIAAVLLFVRQMKKQ